MKIEKLNKITKKQDFADAVEYFLYHRKVRDRGHFISLMKELSQLLSDDISLAKPLNSLQKALADESIWLDEDAIYEIFLHIERFLYATKRVDEKNSPELYPYLQRELNMGVIATMV